MPATNATSERSFSALRRVKNYLRSTMTQQRLNNLMVLHVHKDITDQIELKAVATEFVADSEHRLNIFENLSNLYSHVLVLYFDGTACMYKNSVTETMTTNCLRLHQK